MDAQQAKALRAPFPPSAVGKLPKAGLMLDYVGHAATTDRLLSVDPDWTWEPLALGPDGLPAMDAAGNLWIKLTVAGMTRIGVGDGKSQKERIGDAIRNAAMRFGVALDLWAKEDLHEISLADPSADVAVTPAQLGKIGASMRDIGITNRTGALVYVSNVTGRDVTSRSDLTRAEAHKLIEALERDRDVADAHDDPEAAP